MIFTLREANEILRLDGGDNDALVYSLVEAIEPYLEATTGYTAGDIYSPLAKTAGRFLLELWYYGENSDTARLQRVIDSLLKALAVSAQNEPSTSTDIVSG